MADPNEVGGSLTINVGPSISDDAAVNRRLSIRKFGNGFESDEIFVDVFPDAIGLEVSSTSGVLGNFVVRSENIVEFLNFDDIDAVQLQHSDVDELLITKIGDFRSVTGTLLTAIISYDGETSTVRLTQKVYGIIKVTYSAPFRRYTFKFKGDCPADRPTIDDFTKEEPEIFERATIIATLPSSLFGVAAVTLNLDNPNDRCPFEVTTGETNTIKMEILSRDWTGAKGSVKFLTTFGVFPSGLSNLILKGGQVDPKRQATRTLKVSDEGLTFNGSSSASIRYALTSIVVVNDLGGLTDKFGKPFPANFAKPNDRVIKGTTDAGGNFTPSGEIIIVKKGEIFVIDPAGRERAVTGTIRTSYEVQYDEFTYQHIVSEEQDSLKVIANNDIISARSLNLVGILPIPQGFKLDPKLRGGRTTT